MKNKEYITRLFDKTLEFALKSSGAVLVEGPKWCGKSTTCSRQAKEIVDLTPPDGRDQLINEARIAPHEFLSSRGKPLLIDEWQHVYFIWDQIKYEVDNAQEFGQFILTGSVTDKAISDENFLQNRHTGTGRIVRRKMRTMSLYESGESNGLVSISDLKEGRFFYAKSKATIYDYAFYICRGGWPLAIKQNKDIALAQAVNYYETVVTDDIFSLKSVKLIKDEGKARRVMRSYSRNISIAASDETMIKDCIENNESFDKETFYKYINALEILQVIEELPAWNPNIRSKTAIRCKPTRHFTDPSIAAACLKLNPQSIFRSMDTFGFLFESLTVRDLRTYCDTIGASLFKYRDSKKREADAVIHFRDGAWALIEVKLGGQEEIESAAKKLLEIASDIDLDKTGPLSFLMIVTKDNFAYKREDGVYVVPLACLRP